MVPSPGRIASDFCGAPAPVAAFIEGDARQPRAHRLCGVIPAQCRVGGEKGFLCHIERFIRVAHMAADQPVNRTAVALHDRREGLGAASERQRCQFTVGQTVEVETHRASAVSACTTAWSNLAA